MLAASTGLAEFDIRSIVRNAPHRYKLYHIPKRSGGQRLICHPARELKALQRALSHEVLQSLPVHPAAAAYREGKSIRDNAEAHAAGGALLKYDLKDFFPSIRDQDWRNYCHKNKIFSSTEDIEVSCRILFWATPRSGSLRLAIGAPSSPLLSNILMYDFDKTISDAVERDKVVYTRYADDMAFSAPRAGHLRYVDRTLRTVLRDQATLRLNINEKKTVLATKKYRRTVTGLVISNEGTVSIGHEKKRNVRAAVHHAIQGKLDDEELRKLGGVLSFIQDVEPAYLNRLKQKYGEKVILAIKSTRHGDASSENSEDSNQ